MDAQRRSCPWQQWHAIRPSSLTSTTTRALLQAACELDVVNDAEREVLSLLGLRVHSLAHEPLARVYSMDTKAVDRSRSRAQGARCCASEGSGSGGAAGGACPSMA